METLVSILIFTCGSIIMFSLISSAMNINRLAETADAQYYADVTAVELANVAIEEASDIYVTITESNLNQTVAVDVYGNPDGLYTYYAKGD